MIEIDKLNKNLDDVPKSSNVYSNSKNKIKEICESLSIDTSSYDPENTIALISEYKEDELYLNRVLYSEISTYIYFTIDNNRNNFIANVELLLSYVYSKENPIDESLKEMVVRICDHSNLAFQQKVFMFKNEIDELSGQVKQYRVEITNLKKDIDDSKVEYEKSSKKIQREYISIFGIFSAIIIAFVGGLSFTSSILQSINASSRYRISFITALIAFFIINIVKYLIDFLLEITEHKKGDSKSHTTRSASFRITNFVLIFIMIGATVCFFFDRYGLFK